MGSEECEVCGEDKFMHIEILDINGELHRICRRFEFSAKDVTRYMTRREREEYERKKEGK